MAKAWYCSVGGKEVGPFSSEILRQMVAGGMLGPDDSVRRADMADWVSAKNVRGLCADPVGPAETPALSSGPSETRPSRLVDQGMVMSTAVDNKAKPAITDAEIVGLLGMVAPSDGNLGEATLYSNPVTSGRGVASSMSDAKRASEGCREVLSEVFERLRPLQPPKEDSESREAYMAQLDEAQPWDFQRLTVLHYARRAAETNPSPALDRLIAGLQNPGLRCRKACQAYNRACRPPWWGVDLFKGSMFEGTHLDHLHRQTVSSPAIMFLIKCFLIGYGLLALWVLLAVHCNN